VEGHEGGKEPVLVPELEPVGSRDGKPEVVPARDDG
jgi:hypothetical protein